MWKRIVGVAAIVGMSAAAAMATPSYTAVFLNPGPYTSTYARGINDGQIVGYATGSDGYPLLWPSATSAPLDLTPTGYINGNVGATNGFQQVGFDGIPGGEHAMLWSSSASSAIDLNPAGFSSSGAAAIFGNQEVGGGDTIGGADHALLWTGTAASEVDLNPAGFTLSSATGTNGAQQVGFGTTTVNGQPSGYRALLWNGTAASAADITPAGYSNAQAWAISGDLATGEGSPGTGQTDALLWNLFNGTYTDLGAGAAYAVAGDYEAGYRGNDAMVWTGSADSAVDLQSFLPSGYAYSVAYGVDANGDVVGAAGSYGQWQAVIWLVPEPAASAIIILVAVPIMRRNRSIR